MLYQKTLIGKTPYHLALGEIGEFENHSHLECEIIYCTDGEGKIVIGSKSYQMKSGDFAFVSSMEAHAFPENSQSFRALVLEIGPSLLKSEFKRFSAFSLAPSVVKLSVLGNGDEIKSAFDELIEQVESGRKNELMTISCIYKICALVGENAFVGKEESSFSNSQAVEKALQIIYRDYASQITVDDAASATGYGKSNFCKIFKLAYGESFHKILNRHRIENACYLLSETDFSVAEIAEKVGFIDIKTFYRVFKQVTGRTPCEFRNA